MFTIKRYFREFNFEVKKWGYQVGDDNQNISKVNCFDRLKYTEI